MGIEVMNSIRRVSELQVMLFLILETSGFTQR